MLALVALACVGWLVYGQVTARDAASTATTERDQAAGAAKSLAQRVTEACAKGGAAAAELGPDGTCAKAAEVKDQPSVAQAPTVDPAELRRAARTAVAEYCAAPNRPCRGADGSTPPFDAIVDAVLAKIPTPKNGADGQNGANATAAQVADAVAAYCGQADEPCRGKPGTDGQNGHDGAPGVSVVRQYFDRASDGQCRNFNDFSDGRTRVDQGPAGDAACPAPSSPPPTQMTPAVLPPGVTRKRRE